MRHGGKVLIDQLALHGTERVFQVPGESFLAALDALSDHPTIATIICRHEGAAAMMAEAAGKLTGAPGICFATRGPGAANAVSGVYVASLDATPMILFVGLPPQRLDDQAPFQVIDIEKMFSGLSKWTTVIRDPARIPEYVARAFHIAVSDRPGPVVLGLPENMLAAMVETPNVAPIHGTAARPSEDAMEQVAQRLRVAQRPLVLVGGPSWTRETGDAVEAFALAFDLPIATAFRCQDYVHNGHGCYVGHLGFSTDPALAKGVSHADVILAIGAELGEISTSSYSLIQHPSPAQKVIHVHPSAEWAGGRCRADLAIQAAPYEFARALTALVPAKGAPVWASVRYELREAYLASQVPRPVPGLADFGQIVHHVSSSLPDNAIITNGAGNYAQFVHRYFHFKGYRTGLAPICGSMGYGLPAGIAAKLEHPDRPVVVFGGDGCLQMTATELSTAMQYALPLIIIVANNGMYGTIRMHQERKYPGREAGTAIVNPNFVAFAQSFGGQGEAVTETDQFPAAFARAQASQVPYLIEVMLDPDAISPLDTLSNIKAGGKR